MMARLCRQQIPCTAPDFSARRDPSMFSRMGMRMTKPLVELTSAVIEALPAQLGVYEIVDDTGTTVKIGYAGGNEPFGMRTALERELGPDRETEHALRFRHEFTHGYLTRSQELLMIYQADHGQLPSGNARHEGTLGRLSPLPEAGGN